MLPGRSQRDKHGAATSVPVVFVVGFVAFALARLVGPAADSDLRVAAKDDTERPVLDTANGSAIQLAEDFRLAELRAMPRPASN